MFVSYPKRTWLRHKEYSSKFSYLQLVEALKFTRENNAFVFLPWLEHYNIVYAQQKLSEETNKKILQLF